MALGLCPVLYYVMGGGGVSEFLPFVFSRYPCTLFVPHGDMVGTSQKFRLSFVTNSCTVLYVIYHGVGGGRLNNGKS
jgi:hypothetical protein